MKQFFKMMLASAVGASVAISVFSLTGFVMLVGIISSAGSSSAVYIPKSNEKVFQLSLNGSLTDMSRENPFGSLLGSEPALSLKDVLSAIEKAKENDRIEGIYLDAANLSTGTASVDAIRRALTDFRESGKFVVAYADNYTQRCYYLSSVADKVFLNPQGMLGLAGMASQTTFYRGILKKAGIEMQVFKVGTYKGAVEPFMLDRLSDENREQITSYQQGIWNSVAGNIAAARNISKDEVNGFADGGHTFSAAEKAVEYGLVDDLKDREDVENYIKELVGVEPDKTLETISLAKMKNIRTKKSERKNPAPKGSQIAVIYAEGEIVASENVPAYSESSFITEKLVDELIRLKKNDDVKAVVLRVNSPGGSGYVSEQIWKQVNELKESKKIVVSMGNVAASGGYYISCAADRIISEANTLTGSIGVFGIFPNATGLFDKLDVTTDVVKTNVYADFGDISRPMRSDEKALMQGYIERFYDLFLTRCSNGRGMTKEEIDRIAQGRVWTGEQAQEIGLVDEIGDLDHAIVVAAGLAGLTEYDVKTVSESNDPLAEYLKKQIGEMKSSVIKDALGSDMELFRVLHAIKRTGGIQARLPYDFESL
ncbi:MAG: signal peptide peptidase SppA [Tannerella sp.]|jgi:protease-4|nr:signal peptide peptidase SppA [Tannerella sp.]